VLRVATESETFRHADMLRFLDELERLDLDQVAGRLEAADDRLAALAGLIPEDAAPGPDGWSAREVLAHIAALSKLYGMLTYRIGSGALTEFELLPMVNARDVAGAALVRLPVAELLHRVRADHQRTLAYVRQAPTADLRRRCRLHADLSLSAGEIFRTVLVAHVEQHVAQLEAALTG
jgi:DinB superfamily